MSTYYKGKTYSLTSSQAKQIANLCVQENGNAGVRDEASQMLNQYEMNGTGKYDHPYNFIRFSKWYSRSEHWMDYGESSKKACETTKDVLVKGKRVFPAYINEHDALSDVKSATNNGVLFNKNDRTQYIQNVTVLKNRYGSTYTFYMFPTPNSDPFGYTANAYKKINATTPKNETVKPKSTGISPDKVIEVALKEVGYLEKSINYKP